MLFLYFKGDDISRISKPCKIVERMVNQNTYDDIAQGICYYFYYFFFMLLALSLSGRTNRQDWKDKRAREKEKANTPSLFSFRLFLKFNSHFSFCSSGLTDNVEQASLISLKGKRSTARQSLSIYKGNLYKTQQNVELVRFFSIVSFHCILNVNSHSLQLHQPFCFSLKYLWNVVYVSTDKNLFPSQINLFINCYNFRKL